MSGDLKQFSPKVIRGFFGVAVLLVFIPVFICQLAVNAEKKRTAQEHTARVEAETATLYAQEQYGALRGRIEALTDQLEKCHKLSSQNLSDSISRLQTKTLLVTSLPEQPAGAGASLLPIVQREGLLGVLMEVVQASQKQTGRAAAPAQVWILPASLEPNFAGDVSRAWVIHANAQTGKPVDMPHHPAMITPAVQ